MLRFLVYDEDNLLIRRFHTKDDAINFLQENWRLEEIPKQKRKDVIEEMRKNFGEPPF